MSASDKIESAKDCFKQITTSGRNNYQKFDYLEAKDIFPIVREICKAYDMKTSIKPDVERNIFILTITDNEDDSFEEFYVPYATLTATDAGKYMQDFGRCQTYAQRYLYIQAFEIAVPDQIDNKDQKLKIDKYVPKTRKDKPVKKAPKEVQEEKETTAPVTDKRVKEILDITYQKVAVENMKEFNLKNALWTIKKLCQNEAELEAVKKSLDTYTADKISE